MSVEICNWTTYRKSRCRRTAVDGCDFCNIHKEHIKNFQYCDIKDPNKQVKCSTTSNIKFVPRTNKFLQFMLNKYDIHETWVDVVLPGSSNVTEEADISNEEYIEMIADESKYYYEPEKREEGTKRKLNAKNLKIVIDTSCLEIGKIKANGSYYCEECYKKSGNKNGFPILENLLLP